MIKLRIWSFFNLLLSVIKARQQDIVVLSRIHVSSHTRITTVLSLECVPTLKLKVNYWSENKMQILCDGDRSVVIGLLFHLGQWSPAFFAPWPCLT